MGTYNRLTYHDVFSTRYRRKLIQREFREQLYEYIGGIIRFHKGQLIEIGGMEDHLHLLVDFSPARSISETIRDVKANASRWAKEYSTTGYGFEWQKGYSAFTVSHSQRESVRRYIRNQPAHHRVKTFREEYMEFLKQHDIKFESRYLFETEHQG